MLFIRSMCLGMCYRYTYIHLWIRRVITWKLINLMAHIYSGSRLCSGLGSGVHAIASGDLSLCAPHDTPDIRLLLLGTYHYVPYTTLQIYPPLKIWHHTGVHQFPLPQYKLSTLLNIYSLVIMSTVNIVIQHLWLVNYGDQQEYGIRRIISGVSLLQGFRNTGIQEHRSSRGLVTV